MKDAGGKIIEASDPESSAADAAWILIFGIPAAIARWQGWTIVFWVFVALTVIAVIVAVQAVVDRNSTKWRTSLTFAEWPVALGSEPVALLRIEAFRSPPDDQTLDVHVRITCEEQYERRGSSSDYDNGEYEVEVVVELEETYRADVKSGIAAVPLQLRLPMDSGAPSQTVKVSAYEYIVEWSMSVDVEGFNFKPMKEPLAVGAFVWAGDQK